MSGLINYVSCGLLWLGLVVKAPDLIRHRRDPYLRAICAVLALAGLCFFLGAEPTVAAVNHLGGIPNLAAPLTYASITAYSAASQILIVYWRGGPHVHRTSRRWIVAYALVLLGIAVTFALGDAPVERRTDLDTYYATTPYIAEMIVLYLLGHLAAVSVTAWSALRWAREVTGRLRTGLLVLGAGTLCGAGYSLSKLAAVIARWCGRDWSGLGTTFSPAAAGLGAVLTVVGILIPLVGPRLAEWRQAQRDFVRLEPLERELDELLTRRALRLPRPRWASPTTRLVWRRTSIHNALGSLDAFLDRDLYERVLDGERRTAAAPEQAEATAWAVAIATAVREERDRDSPLIAPSTAEGLGEPPTAGALVAVADALAASPLVMAARLRPGTTTTGPA
jgi:type II secretory pathway pseudopilin PulG